MSVSLSKATAAVAVAPLVTEVQSFPVRDVGDDDAWLLVEASGICGTDWEFYERKTRAAGLGSIILGHEIVGRIAAIGDKAAKRWNLKEGSRVAVEEFLPCGICFLCRAGNYRWCKQTQASDTTPFLRYGATPVSKEPHLWGGFSELLYIHPDAVLYNLPEEIPAKIATLFIPISNGIKWVTQEATPVLGGTVVIMGPGQHGLGCVIAAKECGFERIIVAGLTSDSSRFEMAKALCATQVVDVQRTDLEKAVFDITDGEGVDLVVDIVPHASETLITAANMLKLGGQILVPTSKNGHGDISALSNMIQKKSATMRGVRGHDRRSVEPAIKLIASGKYPLENLCTHSFGLDEVDRALKTTVGRQGGEDGAVHVVVVPGE